MYPILYDRSELYFVTEGKGRLSEATSCIVTEERNGIYECRLTYPATGHCFDRINIGDYIMCRHDASGDTEPFEIYARSAPLEGLVSYSARHCSYQGRTAIVSPFTASNTKGLFGYVEDNTTYAGSLHGHLYSNYLNRLQFMTDIDMAVDFNLKVPKPAKEVLGSGTGCVLDLLGGVGEYKYDRWTTWLLASRGRDTHYEIRYGKNLASLQMDVDYTSAHNAVVPFWTDGEVCVSPGIIESGHEIYGEEVITSTLDLSALYDEVPTQEDFEASAAQYFRLETPWVVEETIDVNFIALWETGERYDALQDVNLCDTVTVYFPQYGVDVDKKVVSVEYDVLAERYNRLQLGKLPDTYAQVLIRGLRKTL